jgi:hypothetical protein
VYTLGAFESAEAQSVDYARSTPRALPRAVGTPKIAARTSLVCPFVHATSEQPIRGILHSRLDNVEQSWEVAVLGFLRHAFGGPETRPATTASRTAATGP